MTQASRPTSDLPATGAFTLDLGAVVTPTGPQFGVTVAVDNGRISFVGDPAELPEHLAGNPRISLPTSVAMPGIVDAHNHMSQAFAKSVAGGEPAQLWKRMWVPLSASMSAADYYRSGKWTAAELLRGGITTVAVSGEPCDDRGLAALEGILETGIRVVYGFGFSDLSDYSSQSKPSGTPMTTADAVAAAERMLDSVSATARSTLSLAAGTIHTATPDLLRELSALALDRGVLFQFHANEHTPEIEYCLDTHGRRPIELLNDIGALGAHVLLAHCTLVTPTEVAILASTRTAVSYNPVASAWKGNAVAPALSFAAHGVRFGLGTDATRSDGFRLMDASETAQRLVHAAPVDDFVAGGGHLWVQAATRHGADAIGLRDTTGRIEAGYAADLLILDADTFETAPIWDLELDLVRFYDRSNISGVYVDGHLVVDRGIPTAFDSDRFVSTEAGAGVRTIGAAPLHKVHEPMRLSHGRALTPN